MKPPSYELQAASQPGEAAPISTKLRGGAQEAHRDGGVFRCARASRRTIWRGHTTCKRDALSERRLYKAVFRFTFERQNSILIRKGTVIGCFALSSSVNTRTRAAPTKASRAVRFRWNFLEALLVFHSN